MVRRLVEKQIDDLDGTEAVETVTFSVNGDEFEIDLSEVNAQKFWSAWSPWMRAARKIVKRRRRPKPRGPGVVTDNAKVRGWAESVGITVSPGGFPDKAVQKQYLQAWINDEVPKKFA